MWMCLHQGCFAAEGRKRSQHCKCPRRHIRIATTIKIHELSMESLQSHFKIKIAQLRESGHYCPSRARRNDTCVRRRAATSAQNVPQPPEAAVVLSRQHVVTLVPRKLIIGTLNSFHWNGLQQSIIVY